MSKSDISRIIYIDEYDYPLPDSRIAKFPLAERDASKLLVYKNGSITENVFSNVADYLPGSSLLVYNNTRVIQARLIFRKQSGARIEIFCLEPVLPADYALSLGASGSCVWKCMVGNLKKWKSEPLIKEVEAGGTVCILQAELVENENNNCLVRFSWNNPAVTFAELLEHAGELPIPPYLNRKTEENDKITYQTVYASTDGSVAAPTAGLHFTPRVFDSLKAKNIETEELTLHVGAGTFQPVKSERVEDHMMHAEVIEVGKRTVEHLIKKEGNIIAVGTTSVRTLESLYYIGLMLIKNPETAVFHVPQWAPYEADFSVPAAESLQAVAGYMERNGLESIHASTRIMIKPGYTFRVVDGVITNFHQPKSTLLLLVSAFVNGNWRAVYDYALLHDFRFLSYGDSSLLLK